MTTAAEPYSADPLWARARAMFARAVAAIGAAAAIAAIAALTASLRRGIIAWLCPLEHIVRKLLLAEAAELHRAGIERARRGPRIEHVPLRGMALHAQLRTPSPRGEGAGRGASPAHSCTSQSMRRAHSQGSSPNPISQSPPLVGRGSAAGARSKIDRTDPQTWRARFSFALPRPDYMSDAEAPRLRSPWSDEAVQSATESMKTAARKYTPFHLARRFEALRRVLENPRPHAERLARLLAREILRDSRIVQRYAFAPCAAAGFDPEDPRLGIDAIGRALDSDLAFRDSS